MQNNGKYGLFQNNELAESILKRNISSDNNGSDNYRTTNNIAFSNWSNVVKSINTDTKQS